MNDGKVDFMDLYPLSFKEFLCAVGKENLAALLSEKDLKHALLKDFDSPFSIDMNLYPEFE